MDARDSQVKGIDRYIPTKRSRGLVTALVLALLTLFQSYFLPGLIPVNKVSNEPIYILATISALSLLLNVELSMVVSHSKHSRIVSYVHPYTNIRWLLSNLEIKHCLFIVCVFSAGLFAGLWVSHL